MTTAEAGHEKSAPRQPLNPQPGDQAALQIRKEQVRLLYRPSLNVAIATTIVASCLAFIQWPAIEHLIILTWLAGVALVVIARTVTFFTYFRADPGLHETRFWENLSVSIAIFAAIVWGAAGIFLFPDGDFARQAGTIVLLAGMASGGVTTLSGLRRPVFIFLSFTMLPLTVKLFTEATDVTIALGVSCVAYTIFLAISAHQTYNTHLQNITLRIKSRNEELSQRKSEETALKTSEILKMIATGEPASDIYNAIAHLYESRHPGLRCSVLTLQGNKLLHGGAPSLPETYCRAIHGLQNGPNVGSCGTSTYTGERVLVENIAIDPKWATLKEAALPLGLRACWSEPILDSTGKVLGAFGMYSNYPALPTDEELTDLGAAARLTGIVMEREQRSALLTKLSNSLAQSGEAIIITDVQGDIEYVNPAFSRITGYSEAEAIGQNPNFLDSGDEKPELSASPWRAITSETVSANKITAKRKDGNSYPAHLTVSPVKNDDGKIINYIGVLGDLSDIQHLEGQLQQAQKMEAIGTLVGGIAHDFNNTLAGITGNLHLAKTAAIGLPNVTGKLLLAEKLAFHAAETIQQLLSFTRKGIVQKKPIPTAPFLREALKLHQVSIPENIKLQVEILDHSMVIDGDVNQLQQALMNLLNNARDAVKRAFKPTITIKLRKFHADGEYLDQHPYIKGLDFACISVSDNGCGIAQEDRSHIFEPFFTTKEIGQGSGLGLSMVYGAIKSHNGHIEVNAGESGQGASFDLFLPLLETSEAVIPAEDDTEVVEGNGETILLVDDNEIVLEIGMALLEELNYKVITAKDGQEAVETYRAARDVIDLLVLDVVMPKMGGIEALRVIRHENPGVKALFCTGYDKLNLEFEDEGINHESVISKPFSINVLSQKIKNALS